MIPDIRSGLIPKSGIHPMVAAGLVSKSALKPKVPTHPSGQVTAIDESTGLPIVRRDAEHTPPPNVTATKIGKEESGTGRDILHASNDSEAIQQAATEKHPDIKADLEAAIAGIKGAELHGARDEKNPERVEEKVQDEGQSPRTIPDYSGFRISVETRAAKDAVVAAIRKAFKVVREKDEFEKGAGDTAFHAHMMQIQDAGDPVTHEVQVLPKSVADNAEASHGLYEKARTGDRVAAKTMKGKNQEAWQKFEKTPPSVKSDNVGTLQPLVSNSADEGGRGESPEQPESAGAVEVPAAGSRETAGSEVHQASPAGSNSPTTNDVGKREVAPVLKTGSTVALADGRSGVVKGISPKGDVEVKLDGGGRARAKRGDVRVVDRNAQVEGVTYGTPGHERPKPGAIAVDLDKTMAHYTDYKGPGVIGKPIAAQVDQVKKMLAEGEDVWIYTARAKDPEAIPALRDFAKKNIGQELPITNVKYPEFAKFIDDRAELPV